MSYITVNQSIASRPRNAKDVKNDNEIRSIMENFDDLEHPIAQVHVTHLRALQYRLLKNEFDTNEIFL